MKKTTTSVLLILALCICTLSGCKKNADGDTANKAMGRYIESEMTLPDKETGFFAVRQDQQLQVIGYHNEEAVYNFSKYTLNDDGSWTSSPLTTITAKDADSIYNFNYFIDAAGNEYLFCEGDVTQEGYTHIYQCIDGKAKYIQMEDWNVYNEQSQFYNIPYGVALLDNGLFAAEFQGDYNLYDPKTGKVTKKLDVSISDQYNSFTSSGNQLIFNQIDYNADTFTEFMIYNTEDDTKKEIQVPQSGLQINDNHAILSNDSKTLIAANANGIQLYKSETSLWQTIVDGSMTSLYLPSFGVISLAADTSTKDNVYYILCYMNEGIHLLKYSYDNTVSSIPASELTIYSLYDNVLIRQAIVYFQQSHPDIKVSLHMVTTELDTTNTSDYIRALNTELLAGQGDDLLLLDHLPYESYLEKNVLADISDIIQPMFDSKEVLSNVFEDFVIEGKYYYVPTKIKLLMTYGYRDAADQCTSLETMISYAKDHPERSLMGTMPSSSLYDTLTPFYFHTLLDEEGRIAGEPLTNYLEQLHTLLELTGKADADDVFYHSSFNLPSQMYLNMTESTGLLDSMFDIAVVHFSNGSFRNFGEAYEPVGMIGINKSSKQQELAKEFLKTLYSPEVQSLDFLDGYSVRTSVIDNILNIDNASAYTEIEDETGNFVPFQIDTPSKEDKQQIIDYCKSANNRISNDETVYSKVREISLQYLEDEKSLDDAVQSILSELSIYYKEK